KANSQAIFTLNASLLQEAGLEAADRIVVLPLPEGGLLVRRATDEDVSEAYARYAARPQPCFPPKPAPEEVPEVEKTCPQCGLTFRTRRQRRVYCDTCKHIHALEQQRAWFRRRGKLAPSYRQRAVGARLARRPRARPTESLRLPLDGETGSDP